MSICSGSDGCWIPGGRGHRSQYVVVRDRLGVYFQLYFMPVRVVRFGMKFFHGLNKIILKIGWFIINLNPQCFKCHFFSFAYNHL